MLVGAATRTADDPQAANNQQQHMTPHRLGQCPCEPAPRLLRHERRGGA